MLQKFYNINLELEKKQRRSSRLRVAEYSLCPFGVICPKSLGIPAVNVSK